MRAAHDLMQSDNKQQKSAPLCRADALLKQSAAIRRALHDLVHRHHHDGEGEEEGQAERELHGVGRPVFRKVLGDRAARGVAERHVPGEPEH